MHRLQIALTKGRLQDKSVELFEKSGIDCAPIRDPGRRLIHPLPDYPMDAFLAKAPDVITYVIWALWARIPSWKRGTPSMKCWIWDSDGVNLLWLPRKGQTFTVATIQE